MSDLGLPPPSIALFGLCLQLPEHKAEHGGGISRPSQICDWRSALGQLEESLLGGPREPVGRKEARWCWKVLWFGEEPARGSAGGGALVGGACFAEAGRAWGGGDVPMGEGRLWARRKGPCRLPESSWGLRGEDRLGYPPFAPNLRTAGDRPISTPASGLK